MGLQDATCSSHRSIGWAVTQRHCKGLWSGSRPKKGRCLSISTSLVEPSHALSHVYFINRIERMPCNYSAHNPLAGDISLCSAIQQYFCFATCSIDRSSISGRNKLPLWLSGMYQCILLDFLAWKKTERKKTSENYHNTRILHPWNPPPPKKYSSPLTKTACNGALKG